MSAAPKPGWVTKAKVVRVIDGDTFEVEVRRVLEIRLLDCWAPESRLDPRVPDDKRSAEKKKGLASKRMLQGLTPVGAEVTVYVPTVEGGHIEDVFTMGRVLAYAWVDTIPDQSLSEMQVASGHATLSKESVNAVASNAISDFVAAGDKPGRRRKTRSDAGK